MDPYVILLAGFGVVVLLTAWVPALIRDLPLSLPIFCVGIGVLVFSLPGAGLAPLPLQHREVTERVTEFIVIISLMGAGLKLDRRFGWRAWMSTWRLLGLTMPLSILALTLLGGWLLGVGLATALLLAAALAPTDPVLAGDVQVGPPRTGGEDEVRFSLTSEAGLNDGLAFPFVNLAIAMAAAEGLAASVWLSHWALWDVVWKLGVGLAVGIAVGRLLGWLTFRLPARARLSDSGDGFVALGVTCLAYGATELCHGYGFLAVFVAARALRSAEVEHEYNDRLHDFAEQTERLTMMVLLVLFGGAIGQGLLDPLDWQGGAYGLAALLAVRPLAGWLGLRGCPYGRGEKAVIAFFGIRGIGSAYYLAYAFGTVAFDRPDYVWSVAGFVILVSIVLHGITVTPVLTWLERAKR